MKRGSTDHYFIMSMIRRSMTMTSQLKNDFQTFVFLGGGKRFFLKQKPLPDLPNSTNFLLLGSKMT